MRPDLRRRAPLALALTLALASGGARAAPANDLSDMPLESLSARASPSNDASDRSLEPSAEPSESYYPLSSTATPAPPPAPPVRRKSLMIAGWSAFGTLYLVTAAVTALLTVERSGGPDAGYCFDPHPCSPQPGPDPRLHRLYIPAIGPFLAIPAGDTHADRFRIALPGVLQLSALAIAIVGTAQYVRDGRASPRITADGFKLGKRLRLGAAPTRLLDGATLTLGARF